MDDGGVYELCRYPNVAVIYGSGHSSGPLITDEATIIGIKHRHHTPMDSLLPSLRSSVHLVESPFRSAMCHYQSYQALSGRTFMPLKMLLLLLSVMFGGSDRDHRQLGEIISQSVGDCTTCVRMVAFAISALLHFSDCVADLADESVNL